MESVLAPSSIRAKWAVDKTFFPSSNWVVGTMHLAGFGVLRAQSIGPRVYGTCASYG